jgi:hypothetical protein
MKRHHNLDMCIMAGCESFEYGCLVQTSLMFHTRAFDLSVINEGVAHGMSPAV